jgi:hypothetical protein
VRGIPSAKSDVTSCLTGATDTCRFGPLGMGAVTVCVDGESGPLLLLLRRSAPILGRRVASRLRRARCLRLPSWIGCPRATPVCD